MSFSNVVRRTLLPGSRLFLLLALGLALAARTSAAQCDPALLFHDQVIYPTGAYPISVALGDFNEDGMLDLAFADYRGARVSILLGRGSGGVGNGTFSPAVDYAAGGGPRSLAVGDFNRDGIIDLAVADLDGGTVSILLGRGSSGVGDGTFASPVSYAAGNGARFIAEGDFNRDGITDLVVTNSDINRFNVLLGRGAGGVGDGTFSAPVAYLAGSFPWAVVTGDFNGDHVTDLAVTNYSDNSVSILLGRGDGTFVPHVDYAAGFEPVNEASGDFNGDGITDLAIVNAGYYGTVSILLGRGTGGVGDGSFAAPTPFTVGNDAAEITIGDFNHDGITDLATANIYSTDVSVLLGHGTHGKGDGTFTGPFSSPAGGGATGIAAGDFNADGAPDLVVANPLSVNASILLGTCTSAPPPPEPVLTKVRDVPNDQGGRVFVTWLRSALDVASKRTITGYRLWRRIMPEAAPAVVASAEQEVGSAPTAQMRVLRVTRPDGTSAVTYWEALITMAAESLDGYGYTAPTTQDSMRGSNPYTAFFVTAITADPFVFYESNVDSGFSVDNLPPGRPTMPAVDCASGQATLHWGANHEADLIGYRIYRGTVETFVPSESNLIAAQMDTSYMDRTGGCGYSYKLAAVDRHGNESHYALVTADGPTGVLVSLVVAHREAGGIQLTWAATANPGLTATVYRRTASTDWAAVGTVAADGSGLITYVDGAVVPAQRYGYRLKVLDGDRGVFLGETWVDAVQLRLALQGVSPNPISGNTLHVSLTLTGDGPASLTLFDLAGRRVASREVGTLGPGSHQVDLAPEKRLASGIYVVRLFAAGRDFTSRAMVIR